MNAPARCSSGCWMMAASARRHRRRPRPGRWRYLGGGSPPPAPAQPAAGSVQLLVVPRPGTISPWSSKATDIAQVCGLSAVRRIERGILYTLELARAVPAGRHPALAALLHDRMIEAVFEDTGCAARLFATEPARP